MFEANQVITVMEWVGLGRTLRHFLFHPLPWAHLPLCQGVPNPVLPALGHFQRWGSPSFCVQRDLLLFLLLAAGVAAPLWACPGSPAPHTMSWCHPCVPNTFLGMQRGQGFLPAAALLVALAVVFQGAPNEYAGVGLKG